NRMLERYADKIGYTMMCGVMNMEYFRVIKVGLGMPEGMDNQIVEQHIPIASFEDKSGALEYAEKYVDEYKGGPNPMLDTKVVYIDSIDIDVPTVGYNKQEMMEALGLGKPLK